MGAVNRREKHTGSGFLNSVRGLRSLRDHRELLWQFTLRNIAMQYKGSCLGGLWTVMQPLLMLSLYTFVFGVIFGGKFGVKENETSMDYALGIFLGLTVYSLIAQVMNAAPQVILQNMNFVKKVVFPLEILPAAFVGAAFVNQVISLFLCLLGLLLFGPGLGAAILWLPFLILPLALMALGLAWLLSSLGVFFRDISHLTGFVSQMLFWASGIFFAAGKVKEIPVAWEVLKWNPLIHAIELMRAALLWQEPFSFFSMAYLYFTAVFFFFLGYHVFMRLKPGFADVI